MPKPNKQQLVTLDSHTIEALKKWVETDGAATVSHHLAVSPAALYRALAGLPSNKATTYLIEYGLKAATAPK